MGANSQSPGATAWGGRPGSRGGVDQPEGSELAGAGSELEAVEGGAGSIKRSSPVGRNPAASPSVGAMGYGGQRAGRGAWTCATDRHRRAGGESGP